MQIRLPNSFFYRENPTLPTKKRKALLLLVYLVDGEDISRCDLRRFSGSSARLKGPKINQCIEVANSPNQPKRKFLLIFVSM